MPARAPGSPEIQVVGAGPAGSAAALAALAESAAVRISERSRVARHKVCGEFISPEACPVLEQLGVWDDFLRLNPARIRRCVLHFGSRAKQWNLPAASYGLSRLELDRLLLERAARAGAIVCRGEVFQTSEPRGAAGLILAWGRRSRPAQGRLFGFKAHFEGPADDAVELFLSPSGYVGVGAIEGSLTNVCGIASEDVLRRYGFRIDEFVQHTVPLAERLRPLSRRMPWLTAGPLVFSRATAAAAENVYPAGDALGFVDPFTGSGILNALLTGRMAGACAARRVPVRRYMESCAALLDRPFAVSALLRALLQWEYASHLASLVPGNWIYRLTRASKA